MIESWLRARPSVDFSLLDPVPTLNPLNGLLQTMQPRNPAPILPDEEDVQKNRRPRTNGTAGIGVP